MLAGRIVQLCLVGMVVFYRVPCNDRREHVKGTLLPALAGRDPRSGKDGDQPVKGQQPLCQAEAALRREAVLCQNAVFVQIPDARTVAGDQVPNLRQRGNDLVTLAKRPSRAENDVQPVGDGVVHGALCARGDLFFFI